MKTFHLIWGNLLRHKIRTALTLLTIFITFLLYGFLAALKVGLGFSPEFAGKNRLLTVHRVSLTEPLPISYLERIRSTEGVLDATYASWFGGIYQDPKNRFPQYPVDPEAFLRIHPECRLPEEQKQAWIATRTGAVAGRATAELYGWEVGDRIPLQSGTWPKDDGSGWELDLVGIYDGARKTTDTSWFLFHRKYFEEAVESARGIVGWYIVLLADSDQASEVSRRLDARFANSPAETKTTTEAAFYHSIANRYGNFRKIAFVVLCVVFFTLSLVIGNTMAQSVRERTGELAVLKTLGFSDRRILGLVLGESCTLAVLGGGLSLLSLGTLLYVFDVGGSAIPPLYLPLRPLLTGFVFVLLLGLTAGAVPAWQALRLPVVDALRKG